MCAPASITSASPAQISIGWRRAPATRADLVRRSFEFLLEREPRGSILRELDLPVIGRYFPEYEATIRRAEH